MPLISIDPVQAAVTANTFNYMQRCLEDELSNLRSAIDGVMDTWQGQRKQRFADQWQTYQQQIYNATVEVARICQDLRDEAAQFEEADRAYNG